MKKLIGIALATLFLGINAVAQGTVTVTAIKANLRGTASNTGIVVTTVESGEKFELIKDKAPWYLVQTPRYVGWIHGNGIRVDAEIDFDDIARTYIETQPVAKPRTTTKPLSTGASPFEEEYVGGSTTILYVKNGTDRLLTLNFGGVKYTVPAGGEKSIECDGGRYEYHASVPRAYPDTGVEYFQTGHRYSWRFYIVRR